MGGITGSASGGLTIALNALGQTYAQLAARIRIELHQMVGEKPPRGVATSDDGLTAANAQSLAQEIHQINQEGAKGQPKGTPSPIDPEVDMQPCAEAIDGLTAHCPFDPPKRPASHGQPHAGHRA